MFTSKYFNMGKVVVTCGVNEALGNKRFEIMSIFQVLI